MLNKSRKHDVKFVEILAFDVIKQLLDRFGTGDGWNSLVNVLTKKVVQTKKSHHCQFCNKGFCNENNVKVQIGKFHTDVKTYPCIYCDFKSQMRWIR